MKIAFINPCLRPDSKRRQLPVGLAYVMTAAKKAGFDFDLIDMDINDFSMNDLENILGRQIYDVYAFGCIVTGFKYVRRISEIIKTINPNSVVIAGNSVSTSIPEILLNHTRVDIGVMGEGDITIVELLRALENKKPISDVHGIVFKKEDKIVFTPSRVAVKVVDELGFPDWGIFDLEKYNNFAKINANIYSTDDVFSYPVNSARGCPFSCTFCYHIFQDEKYRRYSEDLVISEIENLHNNYGCNSVSFWDELTFSTIKSIESRVERLNELDFEILWEAPVRGNLLKKEHVQLIKDMRGVGCDNLSFSLENASPEILQAMNKRMNVSQFIEQAHALWEGGVTPLTSVIFGYPQETTESIELTLKVCEECNIFPSVGFLLPLPATPIYEWARDNGHIVDEVEFLERIGDRQDFHINLTKMSDEELLSTVETGLRDLARKQGLELDSVFKTTTYQKPKTVVQS